MSEKLDHMIKNAGFEYDAFSEDIKANYSPEDLAKFAGIMSLYEPLLQRAVLLNKAVSSQLDSASPYHKALEEWVLDYRAMNETIRALHDKESLH